MELFLQVLVGDRLLYVIFQVDLNLFRQQRQPVFMDPGILNKS